MRVLDLGCGAGRDLASWGVTASDEVTGLDIDHSCLVIAKVRFSNRTYLQGAGERLPFKDESFDRVISAVALPYMNIQKTLAEIHRILVRGGGLSLSLHLPSFTMLSFSTMPSRNQSPRSFGYTSWQTDYCSTASAGLSGS
jgi:ubiquinone/menaquinone biosynthesis C-methylase UbiE